MTDPCRPEAAIADVIDGVAGALTSGEVPSLRDAVIARLGRQKKASVGLKLPALVAAAATVIAVAVHWPHPSRPQAAEHPVVTPTAQASRAALDRPGEAPPARRVSARQTVWDAAGDGRPAPSVPALPPLDGLALAPIQPAALAVAQLSVLPLRAAPSLVVPALDDINRDR
jgi:hypothetical protein